MALVVIAVKHVTPGLKKKLEECVSIFQQTGNSVVIEEKNTKPWPHFICQLYSENEEGCTQNLVFRSLLADLLAKYVVHTQASEFLAELIARYYYYFPKAERQLILALTENSYVADPAKNEGGQIFAGVRQCLLEYLEQESYVNLHGLITFRMQLWLHFLRKTVDKAVDDFLMEKEYQEFIKLLKYFVALQEPKIKQVHVLLDEKGQFRFLDNYYQPVEQVQEIEWESYDASSGEEDQLVSMLITVAPHCIVLHKNVYTQYPKAVDTLKHVFENRVILCNRCKLCRDASIKTL